MNRFRLALVSTGGTIEKTYQPRSGELRNETSVLDHMLGQLQLGELEVDRLHVGGQREAEERARAKAEEEERQGDSGKKYDLPCGNDTHERQNRKVHD